MPISNNERREKMHYLEVIKKSFLVFPFIALLMTIPFMIQNYRRYGSIHKIRTLIVYSFILYLLTIYFLVILPLPKIEEVQNLTTPTMNLIPFSFIIDFIKETPLEITNPHTYLLALKDSSFYVVIFNIFMTIPYGMYLRYYYKCSAKKTILCSFLLSLFFELTQLSGLYFIYPRPYRLFDVDDLLLNTLGGGIGYLLMGLIKNYLPTRDKIDEESYQEGENVSPLRKLMIVGIDLFLFLFCLLGVSIFLQKYIFLTSYSIYYIAIPFFWKGKTIGSNFLKVRRTYKKRVDAILYPAFLLLHYVVIPNTLLLAGIHLCIKYNHPITFIIILLLISSYCIFYISHIIYLFLHKKMYYDDLFSMEFTSTILEKKSKICEKEEDMLK